jgi:hypothetical protein
MVITLWYGELLHKRCSKITTIKKGGKTPPFQLYLNIDFYFLKLSATIKSFVP